MTPITGAGVRAGQPVAITGTAIDNGGGVVAGVEVSTDGGASWTPATGTDHWSFTWFPATPGPATLRVRAADDSANLETPGAGVTVTVS